MQQALIRQLAQITAEEAALLAGHPLDMQLYSDGPKGAVRAKKLLAQSQLIAIRPHTRFVPFPSHQHDFVEIMYICKGSVTHVVGGQTLVLKAGELLFLGRNTRHQVLAAGPDDIAVNFLIRPAFFHTAFDLMEEQNVLSDFIVACLAGEGAADEYLHFAVADELPVQNLVENLVHSLCSGQNAGGRVDQLTMGLLFLRLLQVPQKASGSGGTPRTLAMRALAYIDTNYKTATLRQLAAENGLPEYTASRLVKKELGSSFRELLMEKRFALAVQMLRKTALPLTAILEAVGYENTSYFYRLFQQRYGKSPRAFRAENKTE